jgi:hypothetical protein
MLVARVAARLRDDGLREERLRKQFELPPFLKQFATNLNVVWLGVRVKSATGW